MSKSLRGVAIKNGETVDRALKRLKTKLDTVSSRKCVAVALTSPPQIAQSARLAPLLSATKCVGDISLSLRKLLLQQPLPPELPLLSKTFSLLRFFKRLRVSDTEAFFFPRTLSDQQTRPNRAAKTSPPLSAQPESPSS